MGIFKKIFGKTTPEQEKRMEEDVEKIQSGEVHKIYPILKPGDWVGLTHGAVRRTLLGAPEKPELVIAYGYDAPSNFVFLMMPDLNDKDTEEILRQAHENLELVPSNFEKVDALEGKVLVASGHDFSAEKILCPSHLMKAHELLGADELLVSIPRRRCMMLTTRSAGAKLLDTFVYLHEEAWKEDSYGNAPIYNGLFVIRGGEIEGVIPLEGRD